MANKPVHVNEYVKDDGTYVREHYRGLPSSGGGDGILEGETPAQTSGEDIPFKLRPAEETSAQTLFGGVAENAEMTFDPVVEAVMQSLYNLIFEAGFQPENQADKKNTAFQTSGLTQAAKSIGAETGNIVAKSLNATSDALNTAELIRKYHEVMPSGALTGFEPQLDDAVLRMIEAQEEAEKSAQSTLQKLISTKDKTEYANLYHTYQQQREQNRLTKPLVTGIEYSVRNRNYEDTVTHLKEYQNMQKSNLENWTRLPAFVTPNLYDTVESKDLQKVIQEVLMLTFNNVNWSINNHQVTNKTMALKAMLDGFKVAQKENPLFKTIFESILRGGLHEHPYIQKIGITKRMNRYGKENAYDANELWKAAAYNFKQSDAYIKQNGYLLESTSYLEPDVRDFVRNKLEQQLGRREAKGILFKPDSTLSQAVTQSVELENFIKGNIPKLLSGHSINSSVYLGSTTNLKLALGHVDIYNARIDMDGNFRALIIDTYDFNKADPDWRVEIAQNVQRNGLITNFYTINIIVIPYTALEKIMRR